MTDDADLTRTAIVFLGLSAFLFLSGHFLFPVPQSEVAIRKSRFGWGRRLSWIVSAALCGVGWAGICPLDPKPLPAQAYIIVGTPHLLLVGVAAWASRVNVTALTVALIGCGLAAWLPWVERAGRRTEGFEWEYGNVMGFVTCCGAGYGVMVLSALGVLLVRVIGDEFNRTSGVEGFGRAACVENSRCRERQEGVLATQAQSAAEQRANVSARAGTRIAASTPGAVPSGGGRYAQRSAGRY